MQPVIIIATSVPGGNAHAKPPCRSPLRKGDLCYRPLAADPRKGVGAQTETSGEQ